MAAWWWLGVAVVLAGAGLQAIAGAPGVASGTDAASTDAGTALFTGAAPLEARLAGSPRALPPGTTACANCHRRAPDAPGERALLGPALAPATLLAERSRRDAPPSRFDLAGFCRLLRTGVDPSGTLLGRAMPRYTLDDAQCAALWSALAGEGR